MPDSHFYLKRRLRLFGCSETIPCIWCLRPVSFGKATLEHMLPYSKGGTDDILNLDIACHKCNSGRSSEPWTPKRDRLIPSFLLPRLIAQLRKMLFGEVPFFDTPRYKRVSGKVGTRKAAKKARRALQSVNATIECQAPGAAVSAATSASSQVGNSSGS